MDGRHSDGWKDDPQGRQEGIEEDRTEVHSKAESPVRWALARASRGARWTVRAVAVIQALYPGGFIALWMTRASAASASS